MDPHPHLRFCATETEVTGLVLDEDGPRGKRATHDRRGQPSQADSRPGPPPGHVTPHPGGSSELLPWAQPCPTSSGMSIVAASALVLRGGSTAPELGSGPRTWRCWQRGWATTGAPARHSAKAWR